MRALSVCHGVYVMALSVCHGVNVTALSVCHQGQCWVGDVAQLVERWTGTLLTQVQFPDAAVDFSPRVNFQCRLSYGVHTTPPLHLHAFTSVRTSKIPLSMTEFGGLWKH